MANPSCAVSNFTAACSQLTNINIKQLRAEIIYLMALELQAIGGTNYNGALATNLYNDAVVATCGLDHAKMMAGEMVVASANATAAGASVPSFQDRQTAIACLLNVPDDALERMKLYLLCQLGVHKAYPQ